MFQYWKYIIGITLEQTFSLEHRSASSVWSWQLCVSLWFVFCLTWAALVRLSLTGTVINLATLYFTKKLVSELLKLSQIFQMGVSYKFWSRSNCWVLSNKPLSAWRVRKEIPKHNFLQCRDCFDLFFCLFMYEKVLNVPREFCQIVMLKN